MNQFWCEATGEIELCLHVLVCVQVQESALILQGQGVPSCGHWVLHFSVGASLLKPFEETNWMMWRPPPDLWALPEAVLVYILPPGLPVCFLFEFIAVQCECQCSVSWQQTDALCSLLGTSLTWWRFQHNQAEPDWLHGFTQTTPAKTTFQTFLKHHLTCGYCLDVLSFITLLVFSGRQFMSLLYLVDSKTSVNQLYENMSQT